MKVNGFELPYDHENTSEIKKQIWKNRAKTAGQSIVTVMLTSQTILALKNTTTLPLYKAISSGLLLVSALISLAILYTMVLDNIELRKQLQQNGEVNLP